MQTKQLLFATGNELKFTSGKAVCSTLGIALEQCHLDIVEIQNEDPEVILVDKITKAYALVQAPVIVTDDSWNIPGLRGFPGPYMKSMNHWFTARDFLHLTQALSDRRIFLDIHLAYKDAETVKTFHRRVAGTLLREPRGSYGAPSQSIVTMDGDNGLSIAEVFEKGRPQTGRASNDIWQELAAFAYDRL